MAVKLGKAYDIKLKQRDEVSFKENETDQEAIYVINEFIEDFDRDNDVKDHLAIAVWAMNTTLIDSFGSLEGFESASESQKLQFFAFHSSQAEKVQREEGDSGDIENRARAFVLNILFLVDRLETSARPPSLDLAIRRLNEIALWGNQLMTDMIPFDAEK